MWSRSGSARWWSPRARSIVDRRYPAAAAAAQRGRQVQREGHLMLGLVGQLVSVLLLHRSGRQVMLERFAGQHGQADALGGGFRFGGGAQRLRYPELDPGRVTAVAGQ